MRIVGIDPGNTGALALLVDGHLMDVIDMPTIAGEPFGRRIADYLAAWNPDVIALEAVHCNGQNGSKANWSLGQSYGCINGVISTLRYPLVKMSPQMWKKLTGLIGKDKEASRRLAIELWPLHGDKFKFKKNADRAEAALIARAYGFKTIHETMETADAS